jgi:hypothetical protein
MKKSFHAHKLFGLACGFTGLTLCASAQSDIFGSSSGSSSTDTFGGNPDSYGFIKIPSDTDDWTRHFRIGALVGLNIGANFSEKGTFNIPGNNVAKGIYDDGYVHPDQSGDPKNTSNWGYNNASQYNSAGDGGDGTISMHSITSYTTDASSKENGGAFPGFEMAYGDNLWYWKHARVGWELGVGLLPVTIKNSSPMSATVNQSTYTFDANGIVVPTAPFRGGSSGQGPIISSTSSTPSSQTFDNQTITGTRTLKTLLTTIRWGPSFYWDLSDDFGMLLGAGPAIGIASETLDYNETITTPDGTSHDKGSISGTDVVFGGYVNGALMYHVLDNADIYLAAQYMPLGNAKFSGGGRQAQLNLGGQIYISLGVNWPF